MRKNILTAVIGTAVLLSAQGVLAGAPSSYAKGQANKQLAAELAESVGVTAAELEAKADELSRADTTLRRSPAPRTISASNSRAATQVAAPARYEPEAGDLTPSRSLGYDTSLNSRNSMRQQEAVNADHADELYRYSLQVRDQNKRKRILQQAAQLGSYKAQDDLRHY